MSSRTKSSSCSIVFLLLMSIAALSSAANPDPLYPSGLDWKPGPICTYDMDHNGKKARWTFSVTETSGEKISGVWNRIAGGPPVSVPVVKTEKGMKFTEDLAVLHGTAMTADPGYQWLIFPLEPGKKWDGRSIVSGTNAAGQAWQVEVTYSAKVDGWEKVNAAGKSDPALRVIVEEKIKGLSGNFSGTGKLNMWMGGGTCSVRKVEYKNSFKESGSMILVSE
jgi:hypothetical protein